MAIPIILAAIGLGLAAAGTGIQYSASRDASKAQRRAERARERQMMLENQRAQRRAIRAMQMARAQATATATSQGAGEGSGLQGAYAGIFSQGEGSLLATRQNTILGQNIFSANRAAASAQSTAALGSGLTSLGNAVMRNAGTINQVGQYGFNLMCGPTDNTFNRTGTLY